MCAKRQYLAAITVLAKTTCQDPENLYRLASPLVRAPHFCSGRHEFEIPGRTDLDALTKSGKPFHCHENVQEAFSITRYAI